MKLSKLVFAVAVAPLAMAAAPGEMPMPERYDLSVAINDNGERIRQTRLTVLEGEVATIHVEPGDGRSYLARFTVTQADAGKLNVHSHWNATSATLGTVEFQPDLRVSPGEKGQIVYGNQGPGIKPLEVEFQVDHAANPE